MQDQTQNSRVEQEISGKPWWKTCLIVAIVVIVVFFLVSFLFVRFVGGVGPRYTNRLPASFPSDFVLYRVGLVQKILYYPASEKSKPISMIMTPVKLIAGTSEQGKGIADSIDSYLGAVRKNETVTLTWSNVDANAEEVLAFYAGSMRTAGVEDPQMRQTTEKDVSEIVGVTNKGAKIDVLLIDDKNTPKIDAITVIVDYPAVTK